MGYYVGLGLGYAALKTSAEDRAAIGPGAAIGLSAGLALWDQLAFDIGASLMVLEDRNPTYDYVASCGDFGCSDPHRERSNVSGGALTVDVGYQKRFRPSPRISLLPGAFVGYLAGGDLEKGVSCNTCTQVTVHGVDTSGAFVGPSFKVTFGQKGFVGVGIRSEFFLTGDLANRTLVDVSIGAP